MTKIVVIRLHSAARTNLFWPIFVIFMACLEVSQKFVWWVVVMVESEFSYRLWLSSSLAKQNS
jgi:uncharacterized membrane protein YecN with MAPEG domain